MVKVTVTEDQVKLLLESREGIEFVDPNGNRLGADGPIVRRV